MKDHIVETASKLFYTKGYNNTGINRIIEEANVAKASLYSYFPSKELLAAEYLKNRRHEWLQNVSDYVQKGKDIRTKITLLFDLLEQKNINSDYRGCAFINIISEVKSEEHQIIEEVKAQKSALLALIRSLFEAENKYTSEALDQKSKTVLLLFEGAIVEAQIFKDTWPIEAAKSSALSLI